ncbi:MAG: lasso peptide biosynthesis PqqD family chaperone [Thiohalospira sp.]
MKLTEQTIIQRNPDILASDIDGEKVMMSIQQGEYYGLGKTGSFIWDHIEKPIAIHDLVGLITEKYDVSKEQCLQDILPFLNELAEKKLIVSS